MTDGQKTTIIQRLRHSVQLLASSPEVQLRHLPAYVSKADELALELDQWSKIALHNYERDFSKEQLEALSALNKKLDWLTNEGEQNWTEEAVRMSASWNEVRCLARAVLDSFGWPAETPPSHADEYRPAGQNESSSVN